MNSFDLDIHTQIVEVEKLSANTISIIRPTYPEFPTARGCPSPSFINPCPTRQCLKP